MLSVLVAFSGLMLSSSELILSTVNIFAMVCLYLIPAFAIFYFMFRLPASPSHDQFEKIVIGHRGCRLEKLPKAGYEHLSKHAPLPENCLSSIKLAIENNVDGVEIDTHLTKDNVPVIFHDYSLDRLCGKHGNLRDLTASEVQKCPLVLSQTKECPPLLEDAVKVVGSQEKLRFMIEIKEVKNPRRMAQEIVKLYQKYPFLYKRAYVASFFPQSIWHVRRIDPKIVSMLLIKRRFFQDALAEVPEASTPLLRIAAPIVDALLEFSLWSWLPSFLGIGLVGLDQNLVSSQIVSEWHKRSIGVNVWTCNSKPQRDYFYQLGASVTSDYLFEKIAC
eukprot:ANDGO_01664.mRNA.1 Putative glycerophosphoryl diester phosphodiesterase YhdW